MKNSNSKCVWKGCNNPQEDNVVFCKMHASEMNSRLPERDTTPKEVSYEVMLRLSNGRKIVSTITRSTYDRSCKLNLIADELNLTATAFDYFESFSKIRKELAEKNIYPLCFGASKDIWPSGVCRDMGQGLKAYRLVLGKRCDGTLFEIFDFDESVEPVHPDVQREFSIKWLESIKN